MSKQIGFIGVGKMGGAIATHLIETGHKLLVFDTRPEAVEAQVANGAAAAASVADVASRCTIIILSLPSPDLVRTVGREVAGAANRTARILIDVSTTGPAVSAAVAEEVGRHGITFIDAPVSGGVAGALKGTLAVMVAGPNEAVSECRDVLASIGKVFDVGEKPGLGQVMKLCNNVISATVMAISSEAIVMGVKAGLDPKVMLDVINAASGRNSASQDKFPKSILPRSFDFGFSTGHMYKDVRLCMEEAERLGVQMWVAPAVRQLWLQACGEQGPDSDFTAIVKCIERLAGVEVRG
jgi:3-hydroxyisobutyrate dehydrogenase-like beta-hydroxyacid dehydrogenase